MACLKYRMDFGPGYRVYYGREGGTIIILLGGGTKRRQGADIAAALARWKQDWADKREHKMTTSRPYNDTIIARIKRDRGSHLFDCCATATTASAWQPRGGWPRYSATTRLAGTR